VEIHVSRDGVLTVFDRSGGDGQIEEIRKAIEAMGLRFSRLTHISDKSG